MAVPDKKRMLSDLQEFDMQWKTWKRRLSNQHSVVRVTLNYAEERTRNRWVAPDSHCPTSALPVR